MGLPALIASRKPWLPFACTQHMELILRMDMRAFEWGCGGSTLWLLDRVSTLTTIEHAPKWAYTVQSNLTQDELARWTLRIHPPIDPKWDDLPELRSKWVPGMSLKNYVCTIDNEPNESLDLIVVDGRCRSGCIKHAMPKLKPKGMLLLDNSNRTEYAVAMAWLDRWTKKSFFGHGPNSDIEWGATLWVKP